MLTSLSKAIIVSILLSLFVLTGCSSRKLNKGIYTYENGNQIAILEIRLDNTFHQKIIILKDKSEKSLVGKWSQTEAKISFKPFLYSVDMSSGMPLEYPVLTWTDATLSGNVIILKESANYWYKMK